MFVGWEGVGLCSYLLIGFWFKKKSASDAGKKAFIVNRIGDAGLILGMILAFHTFGTLDLVEIADQRGLARARGLGSSARSPRSACCCSWAPAARARRSRCTSGCRTPWRAPRRSPPSSTPPPWSRPACTWWRGWPRSTLLSPTAMTVVAVGRHRHRGPGAPPSPWCRPTSRRCWPTPRSASSATCSWPAAWGPSGWRSSTSSPTPSSRPCSSWAPGSVIHALGGEQDMRKMGGLRKQDPLDVLDLRRSGPLAIAGIPRLAGFFSKDAILAGALRGRTGTVLFVVGLLTALLHRVLHDAAADPDLLRRRYPRRARRPGPTSTSRRCRCSCPLVILAVGSILAAAGYRATSPTSWSRSSAWQAAHDGARRAGCPSWPPSTAVARHRGRLLPVPALPPTSPARLARLPARAWPGPRGEVRLRRRLQLVRRARGRRGQREGALEGVDVAPHRRRW